MVKRFCGNWNFRRRKGEGETGGNFVGFPFPAVVFFSEWQVSQMYTASVGWLVDWMVYPRAPSVSFVNRCRFGGCAVLCCAVLAWDWDDIKKEVVVLFHGARRFRFLL